MTKQTKIIVGGVCLGVVLILAALFLMMSRQSDITVEAPAPPRSVTPISLPPPIPSTIAVKAKLPIQDVKQLAESALRDYLRKPIQRKDGAIEFSTTLSPNSITMTGSPDGTISVIMPLTFKGWVRGSQKIFGKMLQRQENFEGKATASLTLSLTLNSDWRITAKTTSDILIQKAALRILGIRISIRSLLTTLVKEKVLPKLEELIVEYITNVDVKTRVAGLWEKLQAPIVVNQEPPIALVIAPLEIVAQQLSSDGTTLAISLGIKTYIQANIGTIKVRSEMGAGEARRPRPTRKKGEAETPLPNLRFVESLESGYHIIVPIDVAYTAIEHLAKPHVEKAHTLKGIETHVGNFTLYGSGTQLVVGVGFKMPAFRAKGQLYLLGTPIYNAEEMAVSVTEFNYSLTTQSLLLEIAENAGEGIFPNLRTTVEAQLVFPLGEQLTELREKLSAVVEARQIGDYVLLHGTVDTVTPEALYLTQEGLRVPFRLQGTLSCEVNLNSSK